MNTKRKHLLAAAFCLLWAAVTFLYYRISEGGIADKWWMVAIKIFILGTALFVLLEGIRAFCKKHLLPDISMGKYRKTYLTALIISIVLSAIALLAYWIWKQLRTGTGISVRTIGLAFVAAVGLFALFCIEIQIWKKSNNHEREIYRFKIQDLTISVFCIISTILCFLPVIADYAYGQFPLSSVPSSFVSVTMADGDLDVVGEITSDVVISQTFVCKRRNVYFIELYGATYGHLITSQLTATLVDEETGEVFETMKIPTQEIRDNSYFRMYADNLEQQPDMRNKKCRLDITSLDASSGNAITLYYSKASHYDDGKLSIHGQEVQGDLLIMIEGFSGNGNFENVRIWLCLYYAVIMHLIVYIVRLYFLRKQTSTGTNKSEE